MKKENTFVIEFAGICVRVVTPTEVNLPEILSEFLIEDPENVTAEYSIELLEEPMKIEGKHVATAWNVDVYEEKEDWIRVYFPLIEKDGCQVACRTNAACKNKLYYPKERWGFYSQELNLLHLIGIEDVLIKNFAFILHSSMVKVQGYSVLFCGPSGIGKSTQAELWRQYRDVEVLNGDRCIVKKNEAGFLGCSSPWCGTSGIYRKDQAPIKGIFILRQANKNSVRRMKAEAFAALMQHSIVNSWNAVFMTTIADLIAEIIRMVPIYELKCRPDKEAVDLAYCTLFEGDV